MFSVIYAISGVVTNPATAPAKNRNKPFAIPKHTMTNSYLKLSLESNVCSCCGDPRLIKYNKIPAT
ncbi:MAG: hypothetical protein R3327_07805, partial [Nitrosopumilaceae archaeon]|nr:hypothetical protein [Nitrosopumilaceae archaeon]